MVSDVARDQARKSFERERALDRCTRLGALAGQSCNDGEDHDWQPVSFVFETQLLDHEGRVRVRQPDIQEARVYVICMGCRSHSYVVTEWVGYQLGGPELRGDPILTPLYQDIYGD